MALKAKSIQSPLDPMERVGEMIPLIVPVSMWEILVLQSQVEGCAPGEVLDRALCEYIDAHGDESVLAFKARLENGQPVAQNDD